MAEIVGTAASVMTLASVFKLCIQAFDCIRAAQNQEQDLRKLTLRLKIEKCRLYTWGQAMGFTQNHASAQHKLLESFQFPDLVKDCLDQIVDLFNDTEKIEQRYGCRRIDDLEKIPSDDTNNQTTPLEQLSKSFGNFYVRDARSPSKRVKLIATTCWVIHNRKKFECLIQEAKELIDGLQEITKELSSLGEQDKMIRLRILRINDMETLDMVADVCEADHPTISDAATARADTISLATTT